MMAIIYTLIFELDVSNLGKIKVKDATIYAMY